MMRSLGAEVIPTPTANLMNLVQTVEKERGYLFLNPFDDLDLINGYGGVGLEILQDLPGLGHVLSPP